MINLLDQNQWFTSNGLRLMSIPLSDEFPTPADDNQASADNNKALADDNQTPADDTKAPADDNQASADDNQAPANASQAPSVGELGSAAKKLKANRLEDVHTFSGIEQDFGFRIDAEHGDVVAVLASHQKKAASGVPGFPTNSWVITTARSQKRAASSKKMELFIPRLNRQARLEDPRTIRFAFNTRLWAGSSLGCNSRFNNISVATVPIS